MDKEIIEITTERSLEIINKREPIGLFYLKEDEVYVGVDNSTGDAWVEEFETEKECFSWLGKKRLLNRKKIYRRALETWGDQAQITMAFEEMAELQKELCKALRGDDVKGRIAEEIADVEVMLEQMKMLFEVEGLVRRVKKYKVARLDERLEQEEEDGI